MCDPEYVTMQEIGRMFGSNSHQIGRILKGLGFRMKNREPSALAHQLGLVKKRPVYGRECFDVWIWHLGKIMPFLEERGLRAK